VQAHRASPIAATQTVEKGLGEHTYVIAACAERRELDIQYVEAEHQIKPIRSALG
jgi:hypothetical protein